MRFSYLLWIIPAMIVAIGVGWFMDQRKIQSETDPLMIPDNIDYYLSGMKYRAFNNQGEPEYELLSPYLEHHIREDISQLTLPQLRYFSSVNQWHINSVSGALNHQQEQLTLTEEVNIQRLDDKNAFRLFTHQAVFIAQDELIKIPQHLNIESEQLSLEAASAIFDMKNSQHQFNRVKATYRQNQSNANS